MNKMIINVLIFSAGLVTGAAAGVFVTKKRLEKKCEDEIALRIREMEEYYGHADQYARNSSEDEDVVSGENREDGPLSPEKRKEIKSKAALVGKHEKKENYRKYYNSDVAPMGVDASKWTNPESLSEEEVEKLEKEMEDPVEEANRWHEENKHRPPKEITWEEFNALPEFIEREAIFVYKENELYVDEYDNFIYDPNKLVGDVLEDGDNALLNKEDKRVTFVLNYELDKVYEVQKLDRLEWDPHME